MIKLDYSGVFSYFAGEVWRQFKFWVEKMRLQESVWRERQELAQLSDDQLKDIGISRFRADREASRSDWDLPVSRMSELQRKHDLSDHHGRGKRQAHNPPRFGL